MAEILIEMSGIGGLANKFAGNTDVITPQPNLITKVKEGEMAQGLFNPYLRDGYLAPLISTSTTVSLSNATTDLLASSEIDLVNGYTFFGQYGRYIYIGNNSNDTSITRQIDVGSGNIINDLDIYEVNSERKLFYTYQKQELTFGASTDYRADWLAITARINPASGQTLQKIVDLESYVTGSSFTTEDFTIPSQTNMQAIIFVSVVGNTNTSITLDGGTATLVNSWTDYIQGNTTSYYLYTKSVTSGVKDIDVVNSGSGFTTVMCVVYSGANTTPITVYDKRNAANFIPINTIATTTGAKYLQFITASKSTWDVANITVSGTYNPSAQTANEGGAVAFNLDGTKMYVDGNSTGTTTIYQYTLSTAWDVTTASYATKSKNIESQIPGSCEFITFSTDGTKMVSRDTGTLNAIKYWSLSTAWDISTATYNATYDYVPTDSLGGTLYAANFSSDGLSLYASFYNSNLLNSTYINQYTLGTAWQSNTATYIGRMNTEDLVNYITISNEDSIITYKILGTHVIYSYNFNPLFPKDITKATIARTSSDQFVTIAASYGLTLRGDGVKIYYRSTTNSVVNSYLIATNVKPVITTGQQFIFNTGTTFSSFVLSEYKNANTIEVGYADFVVNMDSVTDILGDKTWLTKTLGITIESTSDYNFLRKADNGFMYLFTQNKVAKIDGGRTGGINGFVTENVLLFPEYFTITDAVDYRSQIYMAVHHYPVSVVNTSLNTYVGKCGVLVWNRISTQLGGIDFIELPGVKEIKKIYASPDGLLKLITISNNGLTQLREFGYNDSGGVVFPVKKEMGIGAFPQFPDSFSVVGDKVAWLANDGNLYCEKGGAITYLFQVATPGATSATTIGNIKSGSILYGSGDETSDSSYRSNKQGIIVNYSQSSTYYSKKIYPFDYKNGANSTQTQVQGDVYTGVNYIPVTSVLRQVRVYNAPITGTGSTVVGTIKLYFNQSSTVGMTKTITKDEAKRGYVDFHINKPYIHGIQIEVEWPTSETLGVDTYLPSVAVVSHDPTTTKSPDNG